MVLLVLGFLYVLIAPVESNQTICQSCSAPGKCQEITCPEKQSFCLRNYTGSDSDLWKHPCMDEQTCHQHVHTLKTHSVSCCQGNCSGPNIHETTPKAALKSTPKPKNTTCYSCPETGPCKHFICPAGKDTCLSTVEVLGEYRGTKNPPFKRNGSCVAPEDCQPGIYSLSFGSREGLWVNVTCCTGDNCNEPSGPVVLLNGQPSDFLCPVCSPHDSSCDEDLYVQCFQGETSCVNMNLVEIQGGVKHIMRGCGSKDLCQLPGNHTLGLDFQLIGNPNCASTRRAILNAKCRHNRAPGSVRGALLPALVGVWLVSWLA